MDANGRVLCFVVVVMLGGCAVPPVQPRIKFMGIDVFFAVLDGAEFHGRIEPALDSAVRKREYDAVRDLLVAPIPAQRLSALATNEAFPSWEHQCIRSRAILAGDFGSRYAEGLEEVDDFEKARVHHLTVTVCRCVCLGHAVALSTNGRLGVVGVRALVPWLNDRSDLFRRLFTGEPLPPGASTRISTGLFDQEFELGSSFVRQLVDETERRVLCGSSGRSQRRLRRYVQTNLPTLLSFD